MRLGKEAVLMKSYGYGFPLDGGEAEGLRNDIRHSWG